MNRRKEYLDAINRKEKKRNNKRHHIICSYDPIKGYHPKLEKRLIKEMHKINHTKEVKNLILNFVNNQLGVPYGHDFYYDRK